MAETPSLNIDFTSPAFRHRLLQGGGRGQALGKAVGFQKNPNPRIVDATAGLGRDGFLLAHLGAQVTMIERSPLVAAALKNALKVAKAAAPLFADPASRIKLLQGDAIALLPNLRPQIIYVDPMHPARAKSALVKQEMRDLREIVGVDMDQFDLIRIAIKTASKRVVVKWPRKANWPDDMQPISHQITGKTTRYLVWMQA